MLVLFDIDGTLISTSGVGINAMEEAGRDQFGPRFTASGVEFAGRLDPLIIEDLLERNGIRCPSEHERTRVAAEFAAGYERHLVRFLDSPTLRKGALPGVPELVEAVARDAELTAGLLTGNFERTGCIKLRACGLNPERFEVRVWANDAVTVGEARSRKPSRNDLPHVAMSRYQKSRCAIEPSCVTIIGDTPHDVVCARESGCRSIAVATGRFSLDQLQAAGADLAVRTLEDADMLLRWIKQVAPGGNRRCASL